MWRWLDFANLTIYQEDRSLHFSGRALTGDWIRPRLNSLRNWLILKPENLPRLLRLCVDLDEVIVELLLIYAQLGALDLIRETRCLGECFRVANLHATLIECLYFF